MPLINTFSMLAEWRKSFNYRDSFVRNQLNEFFKAQMLDSFQNFATFLSLFYVKFWLCLTKAADAPQLDLDLLKLLEEATTKVRDPGTIKMVEAA